MFDEEIHRAAEEALGISGQQMAQFKEQSEFLASKRAKKFDVDNFIAECCQPNLLIERAKQLNPDLLPDLRDEFKNTAQMVCEAVETSPGHNLQSAKGTWWGVVNAVTYVVDHKKKSMAEGNALHSAWFGSGANTKRKALTKALEYANAS
tara:strand:- start:247 stop:696 length:450 start_codon:yes stop_codon:yes gene_type:complete